MNKNEFKLADWTLSNNKSVLEQMLSKLSDPQMISFALGLPAAELFPKAEFAECYEYILSNNSLSLQYQPPLESLKLHIVDLMKTRGVETSANNIFLTNGAQQGANLLVHLLLNFNGDVILEEKTYTGFQQVLKPFAPRIFIIPSSSKDGFDLDSLTELLQSGINPAFFYTVCDGHNPLSLSISLEKRQKLVNLARTYNFPIIEDDPYGFLNYEDIQLPPIVAFDSEFVLYVGTFSKILAPGLRTGWMIIPERLFSQIGSLKEAADINTANLNQNLITEFFNSGKFSFHLEKLKKEYKKRRDSLNTSLNQHFGGRATWQSPPNGLFTWVEFPDNFDTEVILDNSLRTCKVAFIPGHLFNVSGSKESSNCLRLNFTNNCPEKIFEGIRKLSEVIKEFF
jgi:2-aminoadipate transaminase